MTKKEVKLKKTKFFPLLFGCILFFFLIPFFHSGVFITHDGENHIARFASYYQALRDGQFPPRWAGNLNFSYGSPVFIFFYPLPSMVGAIFHAIGVDYETAFKLVVGISFLLAPLSFYFWMSSVFKKYTAVTGAFLYGLAPYHFLDTYVRGDIGELFAFIFIPVTLLCIEKTIVKKDFFYAVLGGVSYGLLILSHNGISLMFSPILLGYLIIRTGEKKDILRGITVFIVGLVLSAFFWIPALYESKYVNAKFFIGKMFLTNFATLSQLIYSPWGFGSDISKQGGISPQIGIVLLLFACGSVMVLFKEKNQRKFIGFWICCFICGFFLSLSISRIIWKAVPMLMLFEFPWRFTFLSSFSASVLACFVINAVKNFYQKILLFLVILISAVPFIQVKGYTSRNDTYYTVFPGTTYYHGEASSRWTSGDASSLPQNPVGVIAGTSTIKEYKRKSNLHTFIVNASNNTKLVDSTVYFPGWKVFVDNEKIPIEFQDQNYRGLITFAIPKGKHLVQVVFQESPIRMLSDYLSLGCCVFVGLFFILKRKNNAKK